MTPAAVDLIKLTQLDPPAPSPAPPETDAAAPSFHEHLRRAERRTSDEAATSADDRGHESTHDATSSPAAASKHEHDRASDEPAQADRSSGAQDQKQTESGDEKQDEHKEIDEAVKSAPQAEPQAVPVTVAAPIVQTEVKRQEPEVPAAVVVADEPQAAKAIDKAIAAASPKTPQPATAAATAASTPNVVAVVVQPTTEQKGAAKPDADVTQDSAEIVPDKDLAEVAVRPAAAVETEAKPTESARHDVAPALQTAVKPEAAHVAATQATKTTDEIQPDQEPPRGHEEATPGARDPGSAASATVAPGDAPVPNLTPATVADPAVAANAVAVESKPQAEATTTAKTTDDTAPVARFDRPHAAEPPQPVAHRDFGLGRSSTTETAPSLSQTDRLRLVQRVARAVQTAQERGGDLNLRLSPPELGSLRLQVRLTDGALSARIETDNPAAKQVLVDNLPGLRERLAEQNIRVERFDVDLSNSGGGGTSQMPQQRFDDAGDRGGRTGSERAATARVGTVAESAADRTSATMTDDGRLNVVV